MTLEGFLHLMLYVVVVVGFFVLVAWGANKLIAMYCPPEYMKGVRAFVGAVLLLLLLIVAIDAIRGGANLPLFPVRRG